MRKSTITYQHIINPASIITDVDRPDLSGPNITGAEENSVPHVPETQLNVALHGVDLSAGVNMKWDASRQVRMRMVNPDNIPFDTLLTTPAHSFAWATYESWPTNEVVGNDDTHASIEFNDPYTEPIGLVAHIDAPGRNIWSHWGEIGDVFEYKLHFREFARLKINGEWFRISEDSLWQQHLKFKKVDENADGTDHNDDDDTSDVLWIDNGSAIRQNHTNWNN